MAKIEDEDIEIPGDGDENVGEGSPVKKREKKRKSKEERIAERKVIFWTLVIILIITLGFWLAPNLGSIFINPFKSGTEIKNDKPNDQKTDSKNYMEITL